ncbi:COP9 signalosome complex subunit 6 [Pseudolycoriella hygida]|uniref:COP9 signalosome complex subunit 6 n=1 Tax=Pseudolycoriella hygida TaxID=35572 RepID=A0A9Q0MIR1_9DIPT|nr:COP9 signalosome complex subunit 6 [Pseudolycoriella hygida]
MSACNQMEVDTEVNVSTSSSWSVAKQNQSGVMAAPTIMPSVTVSLHPLVIMNISEHWTRIRAQEGFRQQVLGALIGKQTGRNVEVMNSFELKFEIVDGTILVNQAYYTTKEEQFKQVFSDLDFLGWYTTGEAPTEKEIQVHKQICQINECVIMLQLNPSIRGIDHLPVTLYESIIDIVHGEATTLFVPVTYTLATEEAERIGVDHVVRMSTNDIGEKSVVAEHLVTQYSAIKMLHSRVKVVLEYIKSVENGTLQANHDLLREAYSLSHRLPVVQGSTFREEYYTQSNDVALITYLGSLTKGCNEMNNLVNKFNVLYDRQGTGRRMRGLFF